METIATLSVQAIERAVAGLDSPDTGVVGDVSALDREVYGLKERIVRNCVETIALHAPVAKDLRSITVALEVTTDLDRIGRYAKDIAESAHELHREGDGRESLPKLREMGNLTVGMIRTAVNAYLAGDATSVSHIHTDDDAVDNFHDELFQAIIDGMARRTVTPRTGAECILIEPVPGAAQRPRREHRRVGRLPGQRRPPDAAPPAPHGAGVPRRSPPGSRTPGGSSPAAGFSPGVSEPTGRSRGTRPGPWPELTRLPKPPRAESDRELAVPPRRVSRGPVPTARVPAHTGEKTRPGTAAGGGRGPPAPGPDSSPRACRTGY